MKDNKRIEINPDIMLGKPVIKGTRITVELILKQLSEGMSVEEILANYPQLKKEDISAAIQYATQLVRQEKVFSFK
ncbi:MAG: DUF433 domain-containing protein [Candidatus Pacebacteria bacterium]|nr:DUF433 domain-containing protein [Candidatus Paceibacterota bacterium]